MRKQLINPPISSYSDTPPGFVPEYQKVDLVKLGCSKFFFQPTAREVFDAKPPADFSYTAHFLPSLGFGLAMTLGASLLVYGIVRAIGWVIGGFAAS